MEILNFSLVRNVKDTHTSLPVGVSTATVPADKKNIQSP